MSGEPNLIRRAIAMRTLMLLLADSGQVADRRFGDWCRARPDQEKEGLARPALGGLAQQEPGTLTGRQVGLGRAQDQAVGLGAKLSCRPGVGCRPSQCHELPPLRSPVIAQKLNRFGQLASLGCQFDDRGKRRPGLAQGERRCLESRRSDRAGLSQQIGRWSRQQIGSLYFNGLEGHLGRARRLERASAKEGQTVTPARSLGKAINICRRSSKTAPVTKRLAGSAPVTHGIVPSSL